MKKWYLLNIWLLLSILAWGQNVEFDTLNVPNFSHINEFHLNSTGHIFNTSGSYSEDGGITWSTPEWGKTKTTLESESIYSGGYKYNLEDFSVDTFPKFTSVARGAEGRISTDGMGNTFCDSNRDEIYIIPTGEKDWKLIQSYSHLRNGADLLGNYQVFKHSDFLFYNYADTIFRCNKFDGSGVIKVDLLPQHLDDSGRYVAEKDGDYFYSEDDGLSWLAFTNLPIASSEITFFDYTPSGKMMILNQDSLVFISDDFGQTWNSNSINIPNVIFSHNSNTAPINPIIKWNEETSKFYLTASDNFNTNFFSVSNDFQSFNPIYANLIPHAISDVTEDFNGNLYIKLDPFFGQSRFFRSKNNGETYEEYSFINGRKIDRILPLRKSPTIFASANKTIFRSTDAGETWEELSIKGYYLQVGYNDEITYGNGSTAQISYDNGDSWNSVGESAIFGKDGSFYRRQYTNDRFLFLQRYDLQSQTWNSLDTLEEKNLSFYGLFISERGTTFLSTVSSTSSEKNLMVSYDDGKTFTKISTANSQVSDITNWFSHKDEIYQFDNRTTLKISRDEGLTWGDLVVNGNKNITPFGNIYLDVLGLNYLVRIKSSISDFKTLKGKVFIDRDENCSEDMGEEPIKNAIIHLRGNEINQYANTNDRGEYLFYLPEGDFEVSATYNSIFAEACDSIKSVAITANQQEAIADLPIIFTKDCPYLTIDLATPRIRRCFPNQHYVSLRNEGTLPADSSYVLIEIDPRFEVTDASLPWTKDNNGLYNFFIGTIEVFGKEQFSFTTTHPCDSVQLMETICMKAKVFPDDACGKMTDWKGPTLKVDGYCDGDSLRFKIKNIGDDNMTQSRQYIIIEDVAIMRISDPFQLPSGIDIEIPVEATGQTVHFEVPQIEGHPDPSNPSLTIEGCGSDTPSLGFFNQFSQNDGLPTIDIECHEVIGAYDPNDKSAIPVGIDEEHRIQPNSSMDYLIRFQNTGTDTAFTVIIVDTLSQWLDVTSFQAGVSSHDYEYEISDEGTIRFLFNNIMLPDSNVNEVASNGFVKYKIAMKTDIPLGTEILNEADIYFDFNEPIRTNETFHVVEEPWILVKTQETFVENIEVNVFPNPFVEQATFEIKNGSVGEKQFNLFSLSGKKVRSEAFDNQRFIFQRNNLPKGIYFYEILGNAGKIVVGKIIIE